MGLWPNELRLLDEGTEPFRHDLPAPLRSGHGLTRSHPAWTSDASSTSPTAWRPWKWSIWIARQVVDELRIDHRLARPILGVSPIRTDEALPSVVAVGMGRLHCFRDRRDRVPRLTRNARAVKESFRLPAEVGTDFTSPFPFSSDGKTFFVLAADVFELSQLTHEVVSKIALATPLEAGYGPPSFDPPAPACAVSTKDPFLQKSMTG